MGHKASKDLKSIGKGIVKTGKTIGKGVSKAFDTVSHTSEVVGPLAGLGALAATVAGQPELAAPLGMVAAGAAGVDIGADIFHGKAPKIKDILSAIPEIGPVEGLIAGNLVGDADFSVSGVGKLARRVGDNPLAAVSAAGALGIDVPDSIKDLSKSSLGKQITDARSFARQHKNSVSSIADDLRSGQLTASSLGKKVFESQLEDVPLVQSALSQKDSYARLMSANDFGSGRRLLGTDITNPAFMSRAQKSFLRGAPARGVKRGRMALQANLADEMKKSNKKLRAEAADVMQDFQNVLSGIQEKGDEPALTGSRRIRSLVNQVEA